MLAIGQPATNRTTNVGGLSDLATNLGVHGDLATNLGVLGDLATNLGVLGDLDANLGRVKEEPRAPRGGGGYAPLRRVLAVRDER